jgi:hypothetical protein
MGRTKSRQTKSQELYWYDAAKLRHDAVDSYPDIRSDGLAKIS